MSKEAWARRLKLLQHLIARKYIQTSDAAKLLDVNKRIALADLKTLAEHGVPLRHPSLKDEPTATDRETAWSIDPSWAELGFESSVFHRLSLLLGREVIDHFLRGTVFADRLKAIDKLIEALTPEVEENIDRRFYLKQEPAKNYSDRSALVEALVHAIVYRVPVSFDYTSAAGRTKRNERVSPLTLIIYRRGLYAAIWKPSGRRKVIPLALDRMDALEVHYDADPFDYPPPKEYDPKTYFADIFGIFDDGSPSREVVLRFPPGSSLAYAREREWMPNQIISASEDGGMEIRFKARGAELAYRILEYGPHCEVVAPPELRAQVAELARKTAALYADVPEAEPEDAEADLQVVRGAR
jgi:predicted DNA-binding transcriptional regulator YafY